MDWFFRGDSQTLRGGDSVAFDGGERFEVIDRLGSGGMGVVYEVLDRERNEHIALKTLKTVSPDRILRFKQEFRALQDIRHPNLISLYELVHRDDQWFFTMELVRGADFLDYVRFGKSTDERSDTIGSGDTLVDGHQADDYDRTLVGGSIDPDGVELDRLRVVFVQLVLGLRELHRAGKVHRDIKPSNILIEPVDGRLVLLDFGLVADVRRGREEPGELAGTIAYMAPEQAASELVSASADWYAAGVLLYLALTGRLPFRGLPAEVLESKRTLEPLIPDFYINAANRELVDLCHDLLRIDPTKRPASAEILERLGAELPKERPRLMQVVEVELIGRERELGLLESALGDARLTGGVSVLVTGESGLGKSALVRSFANKVHDRDDAVVLEGRCYESESVPYRGVDGVIDSLTRYLRDLVNEEVLELLPPAIDLLAGVFPVLGRVRAIAHARAGSWALDPQELRVRAFAALRQLLKNIGERRMIVVIIDDIQWTDTDSFALLRDLLRGPEPPRMLLVATHREVPGVSFESLRNKLHGDVRTLPLEPLALEAARTLAAQLLGGEPLAEAVLRIAEESGGHPLFIDELVRHAASNSNSALVRLDDALWSRISELDTVSRTLIELLAVAGEPITQQAAALALDVDIGALRGTTGALQAAHMVRLMGPRVTDGVEVFHGRIRLAVNARLDDVTKTSLHRLLANALESSKLADPEQLATHWQGAGDSDRAVRYAIIAADRAAAALAFDRAAALYNLALSLRTEGEGVVDLYAKQADSLAKAGRGTEAAEQYLAAADRSLGPDAIEYKRLAAEELLRAGHVRRGLDVLEPVLASVGLSLPRSPRTALLSAVARRAQLRLRGTRFNANDSSDIDDEDIVRLDVCRSAAIGLAMVDIVRGADFQTRSLILALRSGDRRRIAHALALEAGYLYTAGATGGSRADSLLEEARQIAESIGDPFSIAIVIGAGGIGAFQQGQWARCRELCEKAIDMFRDQCVGAWWELATANQFNFAAMFYAGDIAELSERLPKHLREAEMRGDLLAVTNLSTAVPQFAWLARDDAEGARRLAADAMDRWSNDSFDLQHYYELLSQLHVDIYAGDGDAALERVERGWEPLSKSMLMRSQYIRITMIELRARVTLAVSAANGQSATLSAVLAAASRLDGEAIAWGDPLAHLLRAGAEHLRGHRDDAIATAKLAIKGFEEVGMPLHRAAAQRLAGGLTGGARGRELIKTADEWLRGQGIVDPTKMATMLAPTLAAV